MIDLNLKINNKIELKKFLKQYNNTEIQYFLIKYKNKNNNNKEYIDLISFGAYNLNKEDKNDIDFFEGSLDYNAFHLNQDEIADYVKEMFEYKDLNEFNNLVNQIKNCVINNIYYDLINYQTLPYLPDQIEILKGFNEREAIIYLVNQ